MLPARRFRSGPPQATESNLAKPLVGESDCDWIFDLEAWVLMDGVAAFGTKANKFLGIKKNSANLLMSL